MTDKKKLKNCIVCKSPMKFVGVKNFHEGTRWGVLGDLGELAVSKELLEMYRCTSCKKVEFYEGEIPQLPDSPPVEKNPKKAFLFTAKVVLILGAGMAFILWVGGFFN